MIHENRSPKNADEFLLWEGEDDFRWELVNGEAVRLPRDGTRRHMRLAGALIRQLYSQLDPARWRTGLFQLCVRTPAGIRMPDVVVDTNTGRGDELTACAPVFLAEITSDWSHDRDLSSKREDYLGIPSLRYYLVMSQEACRVWLWSRSGEGWAGPELIADRGEHILLPTLGVTLNLAAIYDDVSEEVVRTAAAVRC